MVIYGIQRGNMFYVVTLKQKTRRYFLLLFLYMILLCSMVHLSQLVYEYLYILWGCKCLKKSARRHHQKAIYYSILLYYYLYVQYHDMYAGRLHALRGGNCRTRTAITNYPYIQLQLTKRRSKKWGSQRKEKGIRQTDRQTNIRSFSHACMR